MALKDWKTSRITKTGWNGKRKDGKGSFDVHDTTNLGWTFQASWYPYKNSDWMRKRFKTKSQALKFAKAYMRKH